MSEDAPLTPPMHEIAQTLVFSNDIPCDTTIADAKDGRQLYVVETKRISTSPKAPVTITTDVFDIDADKKNLVASLEWRDLVSDIVTIPSRDMRGVPLSTWLKKSVIPFRKSAAVDCSALIRVTHPLIVLRHSRITRTGHTNGIPKD